jgi:hypothetical protein
MKKQVLVEKREVSLAWIDIEIQDEETAENISEAAISAASDKNNPIDWNKQYEHLTVLT